jgi:hypothetical protein
VAPATAVLPKIVMETCCLMAKKRDIPSSRRGVRDPSVKIVDRCAPWRAHNDPLSWKTCPVASGHACEGGDMTSSRAFAEAGQLANKVSPHPHKGRIGREIGRKVRKSNGRGRCDRSEGTPRAADTRVSVVKHHQVGRVGVEPTTNGLKVHCSAIELAPRGVAALAACGRPHALRQHLEPKRTEGQRYAEMPVSA